jgi:ankyrin repeat protein
MKKIFLLLYFLINNLHADCCNPSGDYSDYKLHDQIISNYSINTRQQTRQATSTQQQEQALREYIRTNDVVGLNSFLQRLSPTSKRNLLATNLSLYDTEKKPFTTTFLNLAVDQADCEIIATLIAHGADINTCSSDGYSPLTRATDSNSIDIIDVLIKHGADINAYDANGNTALYIATRNSKPKLISLLINLNANINRASKDGFTPLNLAVYKNNSTMIESLIQNGANINLPNNDGYSPLTRAAANGFTNAVETLVKHGADINAYDANGNTALYIATRNSKEKLIPLLINLNANINLASKNGFTPLNLAVEKNNSTMIETLIKNGADINLSNDDGFSPLTRAADNNAIDIVDVLIKNGADINAYDNNGNAALTIATNKSYTDLIQYLVNHKANTNIANKYKELPLHIALKEGNKSTIEALLTQDIHIDAQDSDGNTATHLAIENASNDITKRLIKLGANTHIPNDRGITAALLAAFYGKKDIVKTCFQDRSPSSSDFVKTLILDDANAFFTLFNTCKTNPFFNKQVSIDINYHALTIGNQKLVDFCCQQTPNYWFLSISGHNPIHIATMHGNYHLVCHFIDDLGIYVNETDYYGMTPLHYAAAYGYHEIAEYLINKKCHINIKSSKTVDHYQQGATPYDLAIQHGHARVAQLLATHGAIAAKKHKSITQSEKPAALAIFIDFNNECTSGKKHLASTQQAISMTLYKIIKSQSCPVIIFGQYLLQNALKRPASLKDWTIIDFAWQKVTGYLIVPNQLLETARKTKNSSLENELQALGFILSNIPYTIVNETIVKKRQAIIDPITFSDFSSTVPTIINKLLIPTERYVYWTGHGGVQSVKTIGALQNNDASALLSMLAHKGTRITYVDTCFFSEKNSRDLADCNDMIIISGATTAIASITLSIDRPANWGGFFYGLASYKQYSNQNDLIKHFTHNVMPLIASHKPHISNFPHIKFPGSPFTLLAINDQAQLIDKVPPKSSKTITIHDKRLLEVDLSFIKNKLKIKQQIPLIISNRDRNVFEKITISKIDKKTLNDDLSYIFQKFLQAKLFSNSTLENTFLIKELNLPSNLSIDIPQKGKTCIPKTVYNVLMLRGPGSKCCVFLSFDRQPTSTNCIGLDYNPQHDSWNAYTLRSTEESTLYQKLLS